MGNPISGRGYAMPDERWKRHTLLMFLAMLVSASLVMAALAALVVWIVV